MAVKSILYSSKFTFSANEISENIFISICAYHLTSAPLWISLNRKKTSEEAFAIIKEYSRQNSLLEELLNLCRGYVQESTFYRWKHVPPYNTFRQYLRRQVNKRYDSKYTHSLVKYSLSVMVWGAFSGAGKGILHFLPTGSTMSAASYCEILNSAFTINREVICHHLKTRWSTLSHS